MSKSYVIEWKSQVNGRTGRGTKLFEEDEAYRLAEELNREYPGIHHQVVEAVTAEPPMVPEQALSTERADTPPGIPELNHSPDHAFSFE